MKSRLPRCIALLVALGLLSDPLTASALHEAVCPIPLSGCALSIYSFKTQALNLPALWARVTAARAERRKVTQQAEGLLPTQGRAPAPLRTGAHRLVLFLSATGAWFGSAAWAAAQASTHHAQTMVSVAYQAAHSATATINIPGYQTVVAGKGVWALRLAAKYHTSIQEIFRLNPSIASHPQHWTFFNHSYTVPSSISLPSHALPHIIPTDVAPPTLWQNMVDIAQQTIHSMSPEATTLYIVMGVAFVAVLGYLVFKFAGQRLRDRRPTPSRTGSRRFFRLLRQLHAGMLAMVLLIGSVVPAFTQPANLNQLVHQAAEQAAHLRSLKNAVREETDQLKNKKPYFTLGPSGSWEHHPAFGAVGVTARFRIPFPHRHPLKKHESDFKALQVKRKAAEEQALQQADIKTLAQAAKSYLEAQHKVEKLRQLSPSKQEKNPGPKPSEAIEAIVFDGSSRLELEIIKAQADAQEAKYKFLELAGSCPQDAEKMDTPESADAFLAGLSESLNAGAGTAAGLYLLNAAGALKRIHGLRDVRWWHRFVPLGLNVSVTANAQQVTGSPLWLLGNTGIEMPSYPRLHRVQEAAAMRAALANFEASREKRRMDIQTHLQTWREAETNLNKFDKESQTAQDVTLDPQRPWADRDKAWDTLFQNEQKRGSEQARLDTARLALESLGVSSDDLPKPGTLSAMNDAEFATFSTDFATNQTSKIFASLAPDFQSLKESAAKLPPAPSGPSKTANAATPASVTASYNVAYVHGPPRINQNAPEIEGNAPTLGGSWTFNIPRSNPNRPPISTTLSYQRAPHSTLAVTTLSIKSLVWEPAGRAVKKAVKKLFVHHKKKPAAATPAKAPALAGWTGSMDPGLYFFKLSGSQPSHILDGLVFPSLNYDPLGRQEKQEQAASAAEEARQKAEAEKKATEIVSKLEAIPPLPKADDAVLLEIARVLDAKKSVPAAPTHRHGHLPGFSLGGFKNFRAGTFGLIGELAPHNFTHYSDEERALLAGTDPKQQEEQKLEKQIAENLEYFRLKGLVTRAAARGQAYRAAETALQEPSGALEILKNLRSQNLVDDEILSVLEARTIAATWQRNSTLTAYRDAVLQVELALMHLPEAQQASLGLRWEPLPPAQTPPLLANLEAASAGLRAEPLQTAPQPSERPAVAADKPAPAAPVPAKSRKAKRAAPAAPNAVVSPPTAASSVTPSVKEPNKPAVVRPRSHYLAWFLGFVAILGIFLLIRRWVFKRPGPISLLVIGALALSATSGVMFGATVWSSASKGPTDFLLWILALGLAVSMWHYLKLHSLPRRPMRSAA